MAQVYYRSDQASITVESAQVPKLQLLSPVSWDVLEGGENTVDGITLLPGGMAPQVAKGGIPKRSTATVKRLWGEGTILVYKELDEVAGNAEITINYSVLNTASSTAYPSLLTYTGVLGTVSRPNYDSTKSEAAYLTIMVELNGGITGT